LKNYKNIILGSIISTDFEVIFGGLKLLFPNGQTDLIKNGIKLIIVPHEPNSSTINGIIRILDEWQVNWQKFSKFNGDEIMSALIVDEVGLLADIYSIGRCAYVGAGFGDGVHSVVEPAVHGCPVSFGPNIKILDEAIDLHENGLAKMINSKYEFSKFLSILYDDYEYTKKAEALKVFIQNRKCDIQKILEIIES